TKDASITQLTDVQGGVTSLSWSRQNDRLVFSAFNRGGFDVFTVKEPLSLDPVLERLRRQAPQTVLSVESARAAGPDSAAQETTHGALAGAWPDTLSTVDTVRVARPAKPRFGPWTRDSLELAHGWQEPPAWEGGSRERFPTGADTMPRLPTLSPQLGTPRLFSDRNFGFLLSASYPFDRFRRLELGYTQMFVDRTFFAEDELGFFQTGKEFRSVSSPTVSLIHDNALFGYYGPVNGQRSNLTFSPSFAWFDNGLAYRPVTLDPRRYRALN